MSGLSRLRNMFRVPDLRNKVLFTIFIIFIFRLGSYIPVPYVDFHAIMELKKPADATRRGRLPRPVLGRRAHRACAVFALGIMPYITSSIIMQLLGVVIPKLEEWQNEGQTGQKKITQWTRYLTVALALMQSTGVRVRDEERQRRSARPVGLAAAHGPRSSSRTSPPCKAALIILTWTAGTALVMWLGELITQRGIGNGMSILIFASVVSRLPFQGGAVLEPRPASSSSSSSSSSRIVDDPRRSSRSSRGSGEYPCSSRNASWAAACTAARAPTSR